MAEMCLECLNKYDISEKTQLSEKDVSLEYDICEFCGKYKPCVISIYGYYEFKGKSCNEKSILSKIKNHFICKNKKTDGFFL